jgi:hypothetical protein
MTSPTTCWPGVSVRPCTSTADPSAQHAGGSGLADWAAVSEPTAESRPIRSAGDVIIGADVIGTVAFTVTAVYAAVVFTTPSQWVGAITAMSLFAVGVFAFLWSFYNAVQRSRAEELSVTQVYLLLGTPTPKRVRRIMLSMLLVQIVVGLATAIGRSESADGSPGTSLAVGVLVPMYGIGLNGLWAAFHGVFPPRTESTAPTVDIGQNDDHG